jgi:hypothetical protein
LKYEKEASDETEREEAWKDGGREGIKVLGSEGR